MERVHFYIDLWEISSERNKCFSEKIYAVKSKATCIYGEILKERKKCIICGGEFIVYQLYSCNDYSKLLIFFNKVGNAVRQATVNEFDANHLYFKD